MVLVPEGPFCMGCDPERDPECVSDELPAHEIWLSAFEIHLTEVTQAAYEQCVSAGACPTPDEEGTCINKWDPVAFADHPVVCVGWESAKAYCEWAGKALPTEAQWEKAARGPDGAIYPWGDSEPSCELANFGPPDEECVDATVAVGSYPAGQSPYGALDMAGNVWERAADWYFHDYYWDSPHVDPEGPNGASARVIRGGSFSSVAEFQRSSFRDGSRAPWLTARNVGFRCARPSS
jgi:formylglycine-generating enzyme required for sulfatase activity